MSDACDALDALLAREAAAFERSAPTERLLGAVTPEVRDAAERVARWALDEDLLFAATAHALSRVVTQLDGGVLARAQPPLCVPHTSHARVGLLALRRRSDAPTSQSPVSQHAA